MSTLFDNILFNAVAWAKEAGAKQLEYFRSNNLAIETKLNQSDIVTAADKASEAILIDHPCFLPLPLDYFGGERD